MFQAIQSIDSNLFTFHFCRNHESATPLAGGTLRPSGDSAVTHREVSTLTYLPAVSWAKKIWEGMVRQDVTSSVKRMGEKKP